MSADPVWLNFDFNKMRDSSRLAVTNYRGLSRGEWHGSRPPACGWRSEPGAKYRLSDVEAVLKIRSRERRYSDRKGRCGANSYKYTAAGVANKCRESTGRSD